MNGKFKDFVNNIGVLCETWALTYEKFLQLGYDNVTALKHTREFTAALMAASSQRNGNQEEA
jgi:hypothetical protein